jgi:hypothetical protein
MLPSSIALLPVLLQATPGAAVQDHLRAGRYLAALAAAEHEQDGPSAEILLDLLGLTQSFVGLEAETRATFDALGVEEAEALEHSPVDDALALPALETIVEQARGRRIVILNESHHQPRHRAFALELATALRAEGFDTFAAETFQDVQGTLTRGYPTASTGFYTYDPVFAELVRGALALEYRLVAYEWTPTHAPGMDVLEQIRQRETAQAENLARVLEADPEARLLVYVGYSHATENWVDPGGPKEQAWMAARLADLTGEDPLTIDQTTGVAHSRPELASPHWRRALAAGRLEAPKVFRDAEGTFVVTGKYAGKVDLQVFHPDDGRVAGRPDWLTRGRKALPVPAELAEQVPEGERVLLQAFHAAEGRDAPPADQFVVNDPHDLPSFWLVPGEYRLALQAGDGSVVSELGGLRVE